MIKDGMLIQKYPVQIKLDKRNDMVYFSQLDIIHLLERALRRADLPLYFTQGFNPHVKISFSNGLKLGIEGEIGATLYFTQEISYAAVKEKLSLHLPQGLTII